DKIEKIGRENVEKELAEYEIPSDDVKKILDFVSIGGNNDEKTDALKKLGIDNEMFCEGVKEIEEVCGYMRNFGIEEGYFMIDLTIARGLDYYTGTVYETVLDDYRELGSVCSGGRYDNLTEFYTKQKLPGIGISIGLTRLFSQLIDKKIISAEEMGLVDVLVVPMGEIDSYVLGAADKIREIGLKTDVYYGAKGMKQKMKYADKCGIAYAAIIGEDEEKGNFITIKGMKSGEQKQVPLDDIKNAF
ncbi:MAG: ATP phosphoribosyltransferase regulatory subunit, partial [Firmicutes bacterium]|nr:ATP phosphoribosyltransferase regulatory subunit [Bacillota bacterium]